MLLLASLGGPWQNFFGISAETAVAIIAYVGRQPADCQLFKRGGAA